MSRPATAVDLEEKIMNVLRGNPHKTGKAKKSGAQSENFETMLRSAEVNKLNQAINIVTEELDEATTIHDELESEEEQTPAAEKISLIQNYVVILIKFCAVLPRNKIDLILDNDDLYGKILSVFNEELAKPFSQENEKYRNSHIISLQNLIDAASENQKKLNELQLILSSYYLVAQNQKAEENQKAEKMAQMLLEESSVDKTTKKGSKQKKPQTVAKTEAEKKAEAAAKEAAKKEKIAQQAAENLRQQQEKSFQAEVVRREKEALSKAVAAEKKAREEAQKTAEAEKKSKKAAVKAMAIQEAAEKAVAEKRMMQEAENLRLEQEKSAQLEAEKKAATKAERARMVLGEGKDPEAFFNLKIIEKWQDLCDEFPDEPKAIKPLSEMDTLASWDDEVDPPSKTLPPKCVMGTKLAPQLEEIHQVSQPPQPAVPSQYPQAWPAGYYPSGPMPQLPPVQWQYVTNQYPVMPPQHPYVSRPQPYQSFPIPIPAQQQYVQYHSAPQTAPSTSVVPLLRGTQKLSNPQQQQYVPPSTSVAPNHIHANPPAYTHQDLVNNAEVLRIMREMKSEKNKGRG